ncbi:glycosyltransferase family 2 protein [Curtobacterium sp. MCJR17_055]|uniref:glycosyltransferase family A protein n=1 Tax=unclassified Curtobacterium TaxID=257496 RepID=UPI000D945956|nr:MULTISPECIES: glycosyltransferase family A protein [unclassified Curtobacterium]PYY32725.1 glycosyltransferase family 2 protein [Curtobacterium sp. MCBD17_029]PYY55750.1 glycosyltransferase family 2 protein [Curtobacterium sp. MCJR17_055]PYY60493.1 glycosyltransferase family 2 protein [Curtobacterium sp. MCPF17_015]WIB34935.1 glycosyltransferase family A protein [Curtobacterium sp. MCJR17_043]
MSRPVPSDTPETSAGIRLGVIVPAWNEARLVPGLLDALRDQVDPDFTVVVCDNGSTDGTERIVADHVRRHDLSWQVVVERQKGTGAASDTAARVAIAAGCTHLVRTDADCLPAPDWTATVKRLFAETDHLFFGGLTLPRRDDLPVGPLRYRFLCVVNEVAIWCGRLLPENRGRQYQGPYVMVAGNNLAITSELYERVGGFPRTAIEDTHEDRDLTNAVRRVTDRYGLHREMVVTMSVRRIAVWGIVRSLAWYAGHRYRPRSTSTVDVRP